MLISLTVKPGSKKGPLVLPVEGKGNEYVVYLREKAHDGEANEALIRLLAKHFNLPKTSIKIKSGHASRKKIVEL